jgi:hypothetical protein
MAARGGRLYKIDHLSPVLVHGLGATVVGNIAVGAVKGVNIEA